MSSKSATVKPKFRSRKLDFKRPMAVLHPDQVADMDEDVMNRAAPLVATGVEKEEEEEHHLQAVIHAQTGPLAKSVYIPIPDATQTVDFYDQLYHRHFRMPKSLIRFSSTVEECIGVPYCMDEVDVEWLSSHNDARMQSDLGAIPVTDDDFERMIFELERITEEQRRYDPQSLATQDDLASYLLLHPVVSQPDAGIIYSYWRSRREQKMGQPLMPQLKSEEVLRGSTGSDGDPFICFRRREIRSTRKTRRTDAQSLQRLRQLRSELESARLLIEMIYKRERMRKETLLLEQVIFEQRALLQELKEQLDVPDDILETARSLHRKKAMKAKATLSPSKQLARRKRASSSVDEDSAAPTQFLQTRDPIAQAIESEIKKRKVDTAFLADATESRPFLRHPAALYVEPELSVTKGRSVPRGRFRFGRGGRVWVDRCRTPGDLAGRSRHFSADQWLYDDFGDDPYRTESDVRWLESYRNLLQSQTLLYRLGLLKDQDLQSLTCQPYEIPPVSNTSESDKPISGSLKSPHLKSIKKKKESGLSAVSSPNLVSSLVPLKPVPVTAVPVSAEPCTPSMMETDGVAVQSAAGVDVQSESHHVESIPNGT